MHDTPGPTLPWTDANVHHLPSAASAIMPDSFYIAPDVHSTISQSNLSYVPYQMPPGSGMAPSADGPRHPRNRQGMSAVWSPPACTFYPHIHSSCGPSSSLSALEPTISYLTPLLLIVPHTDWIWKDLRVPASFLGKLPRSTGKEGICVRIYISR